MSENTALAVFEGRKIQRAWHNNEWWFSVVDIVLALTDSIDPKQYIKKMQSHDPVLNANRGTICTPIELTAPDGKKSRKSSHIKIMLPEMFEKRSDGK